MTEGTVEMRWIERKVGTGRVRLVLEYRTRAYNIMGTLLNWTAWTEVPRVVSDDDDESSRPNENKSE
jgi:hypothetical protein